MIANFFNFVQKAGILKLFIAFILLMISVLVIRNSLNNTVISIFTWIGGISGLYLIIVGLTFAIVGIVNAFKDKK